MLAGVDVLTKTSKRKPGTVIKMGSGTKQSEKVNGADNKKNAHGDKEDRQWQSFCHQKDWAMKQSEKNHGADKMVTMMKKTYDEEDKALQSSSSECRKIFMNNRDAWEKLLPIGNSGQSWPVVGSGFGEEGSFEACQAAKKRRFRVCCDDLTTHRGLLGAAKIKTDSGLHQCVLNLKTLNA